MVLVVSILILLGSFLLIVLALGVCRASSLAEEMLGGLYSKQLPDALDGERG